jgi:NAD(P)H-flavin reductase
MAASDGNPMIPAPFHVERVRRETRDTFTLELRPANGAPPRCFAPGQFNMLYHFGTGEVPISISGDPARLENLVHTTRAVGTVTQGLQRLKRGGMLGVRGPFGTSWPVAQAEGHDVVIVAGGIGLAPLRPVIYHVLAHRSQYGKLVVLYGARTPGDILFPRELRQWRSRIDTYVDVTVDRGGDDWRGSVGVVTLLLSRVRFDPLQTTAMVCGPEIMMRHTVLALRKSGVALENVYLSMERNMKCGIGLCGHCQCGPSFVCKDGPVYPYESLQELLAIREI